MRGQILHYSDGEGRGYITGDDGERYEFTPADMKQLRSVRTGDRVDFKTDGGEARDIFVIGEGPAEAATAAGAPAEASEIPPGHPSLRHKLGNPIAYFKKCLSLYADGKGRAGVAEYWSFTLVWGVLAIVPLLLMAAGFGNGFDDPNAQPGPLFFVGFLLAAIISLGLVVPGITVGIRRLHDLGLSGWWYLAVIPLAFIPFGGLVQFIVSVIPSSDKTNRHGPSPKMAGRSVGEVFA